MNILFSTENYFPKVSGVPVVVRYLAEGLKQKGHNVSIVTQAVSSCSDHEQLNGVDIIRYKIWSDWKHSYRGDIKGYVDYVLNADIDILVIECSECITTDLILPHLKYVKAKIIFHAHGLSGFDNKFFEIKDSLKHTIGSTYNWINSKIYFNYKFKKAFDYIDAFMCLSEVDSGIDYVKEYAKKWYILDNAADDMFFSSNIVNGAIAKYLTLTNDKYMLSCANYTVVKNQKDMIMQYFLSHSSNKYSLVCIGSSDNDYYYECKELVEQLEKQYGHRDVHLLHGIKRSDIPSIVKGSSLYLVTSRWEQYSISIIEAMSLGVPFISTNVGNARVLPGGKTIGKESDMYYVIDELLTDREQWERYSLAGKNYAYKNCRINAVVNKLEDIIKNI